MHQPDKYRLLAIKRRDEHGYTDIPAFAMRDEPEAITQDDYEIHILGRAQTAAQQQLAIEEARLEEQRRLLTLEQRLVQVQSDARKQCMDVTREIRLVQLMLTAGKQVRHIERKVSAVERRVYRTAA